MPSRNSRRAPAWIKAGPPGLGDRSYLIHDGGTAVVIDPQRDIDRVLQVAETSGVQISHVLETHIHNDYVTGGLALAQAASAAYVVAAADEVGFSRIPARDGDEITAGGLALTVVATPGHTPPATCPMYCARARAIRWRCSPAGRCCSARSAART
jgi:hydroxyacylglutathione hydrolase